MVGAASRRLAFDEVLEEELDAIKRRRENVYNKKVRKPTEPVAQREEDGDGGGGEYQRLGVVRRKALRKHLVGLALSGGGIRSATFAVGILQGLARLDLLKRIDYLSTVSGGGYAGSWLAAWIRREGSVSNVEEQLTQGRVANAKADRQLLTHKDVVDEEPEPIYHLRAYSRFLSPRSGPMTADAWSILATYARNISINLLMLLPAAMIVVLLVRAVTNLFNFPVPSGFYDENVWILSCSLFGTGCFYLFLGLGTNARAVNDLRHTVKPHPPVDKAKMIQSVVLPLLVATVLLPLALMTIFWWLLPEMIRDQGGRHSQPSAVVGWMYKDWLQHLDRSAGVTKVRFLWKQPWNEWKLRWSYNPDYAVRILLSIGLAAVAVWGWRRGWKRWTLIVFGLLVPLVLTLLSRLTYDQPQVGPDPARLREFLYYLVFPCVFAVVLLLVYIGGAWGDPRLRSPFLLRGAVVAGIAGGLLLAAVVHFLYQFCQTRPDLLATFTPPACLLVLFATTVVHVAWLGHDINEDEREWWAYLDAYLVLVAFGWLATFGTVIYLPAALHFAPLYIENNYIRTGVLTGLISIWAGTTLAGVLAGRSRQTGSGQGNVSLETVAAIAPPVFLIGLFSLLSVLASEILQTPQPPTVEAYFDALNDTPSVYIVVLASLLGGLFMLVSRKFDVNLFSLNEMYANRLARCYLGASRKMPRWDRRWGPNGDRREGGGAPTNVGSHQVKTHEQARRANPVTGFDSKDDVPLASFQIGAAYLGTEYWGPHLLINTSLSLVATEDLAWSDRKSESFVLSPLHCGSKGTGYAPIDPKKVEKALTIGRAIAVSGAAVDPNMSYHQSAALSAFLTIFNARLGYWIENPRPPKPAKKAVPPEKEQSRKPWTGGKPRHGNLLVSELLGGTDNKGEFVHLTDGGHFENTGVYELVRRRCRYIIACDASTDRTASDENLANLIRLVRIDFGVRIEIDTSPLQLDGDDTRNCRSHVVIGSIRYDDVDNGQGPGVLVYIRTSMTGDESPDIRNYATVNRDFPYTTTANQFFDEAQFESYRALGDHVARVVFEEAKSDAERTEKLWSERDYDTEFRRGNNRLFSAVRRRWAESIPGHDARFLESTRGYIQIQKTLRRDPALRDFSFQVYPELGGGSDAAAGPDERATTAAQRATAAEGRRVELFAVAQMLQAIENAWVGLDLKSHPDEPISHGWWSIFRRWTATEAFHRNWPILRPEFSTEFVRFVETRLGLVPAMPEVVPWDRVSEAERTSLIAEFDREWPKPTFTEDTKPEDREGTIQLSLAEMIHKAAQVIDARKVKGDAVWGILQEPKSGSEDETKVGDCRGIVLVFEGSSLQTHAKPKDQPDIELLIWIRRPHRRIGLGSYAMEVALKMIEKGLDVPDSAKRQLHARYPRVVGDAVRSMWKRFFSIYDFESEPDASSEGDISVCLHRSLDVRQQ